MTTVETCAATKLSPTATGDLETRCAKPLGHVERGDPDHEGRHGVFPIRWRDPAATASGT